MGFNFYLKYGYNFFFKKFYFSFFFNKIISKSNRFIIFSGSEKSESILSYIDRFFFSIKYGFTRYNYIVPLVRNNYEFNYSDYPSYSIFFFTGLRFLFLKTLTFSFIQNILYFILYNYKFYYEYYFFLYNLVNKKILTKKKFIKDKQKFIKQNIYITRKIKKNRYRNKRFFFIRRSFLKKKRKLFFKRLKYYYFFKN